MVDGGAGRGEWHRRGVMVSEIVQRVRCQALQGAGDGEMMAASCAGRQIVFDCLANDGIREADRPSADVVEQAGPDGRIQGIDRGELVDLTGCGHDGDVALDTSDHGQLEQFAARGGHAGKSKGHNLAHAFRAAGATEWCREHPALVEPYETADVEQVSPQLAKQEGVSVSRRR